MHLRRHQACLALQRTDSSRARQSAGRMSARPETSRTELRRPIVGRHRWNVPTYERRTMFTFLKALLMSVIIVGLYAPTTLAQKSAGGVTGEARLHPGMWDQQRSSRSYARTQGMYRSAPAVVRSEQAPVAVAQAPTERRSLSYEPSRENGSRTANHCGSGTSAVTEKAPATANRSTETRRSFSYEPSTASQNRAPTTQIRSSRSSRTPLYLLQKTDPRKYRGY